MPPQDDGRGPRRSAGSPKSPTGGSNSMGMVVLMALPWLMFLLNVLVFSFMYHHYWTLVWGVIIGGFVLSMFFFTLNDRARMGGSWYYFLGVLCVLACTWGTVGGLYNYYTNMFQYWSYDENRAYTNVLPSEPAAGHADAGKIVFSSSARIDTTRAVGYKSGSTYCVAPILDDSQVDRVQYWAAGIDCCPMRGDFNCDDAWNPKARSGVVVLESNQFMVSKHAMYLKAVHMAVTAFGLVAAKEPMLLRWVADPQSIQDGFWRGGIGFIAAVACIYLLLSIIAGTIFQMWSRRSAQSDGLHTQG